jgi:hypothetical protein
MVIPHDQSQGCGSARYLTGSGSNYCKRPDTDPDINEENYFINSLILKEIAIFKNKLCRAIQICFIRGDDFFNLIYQI